jgi:hypothetical protein
MTRIRNREQVRHSNLPHVMGELMRNNDNGVIIIAITLYSLAIIVACTFLIGFNEKRDEEHNEIKAVSISSSVVHSISDDVIISENTVTEECGEEQEPEHAYYCIVDEGTTFYMDNELQDYLYDNLKKRGHEDAYELMIGLAYHESKFEADAISETGDYGLYQINKCNHKRLSKELGITDFLDPYQSIDCGIYMMCYGLDEYDNDFETALVLYNQGHVSGSCSTEYSRGVMNDVQKLNTL